MNIHAKSNLTVTMIMGYLLEVQLKKMMQQCYFKIFSLYYDSKRLTEGGDHCK